MINKSFDNTVISDYTCTKCSIKNILNQIKSIEDSNTYKDIKIEQLLKLKKYLETLSKDSISDSLEIAIKNMVEFCDENNCSEILKDLKFKPFKIDLIKKSKINQYPKILTIHVQRVFYEEDIRTSRLKIIFPESLNFLLENKEYLYELTGFIEHFGTHDFGHYIAYRRFYDKWFYINDANVKLVDKKIAYEVSNPYMLFYRLKNN